MIKAITIFLIAGAIIGISLNSVLSAQEVKLPKLLQLNTDEQRVKTDYVEAGKLIPVNNRVDQNHLLRGFMVECYKHNGDDFIITDNKDCLKTKLTNYNNSITR